MRPPVGYRFLLLLTAVCLAFPAAARSDGSAQSPATSNPTAVSTLITDVRVLAQQSFVDVIIHVDGSPIIPTVFTLGDSRLVIDFPDTRNGINAEVVTAVPNALVTRARIGEHLDPRKVRVVLDLKKPVAYTTTQRDLELAIRLTDREQQQSVVIAPTQLPDAIQTPAPVVKTPVEAPPRVIASAISQSMSSSTNVGQAAATDASGNVYVAGYTSGGVQGQTNAGMLDGFVTKYDPQGIPLWTRQLGTAGSDVVQAVASDAAGNVGITGYTYGSFDGQAAAGLTDLFVAKYDPQGTQLWIRQLGTSSLDQANGIAIGPSGAVYVTGFTEGRLDGETAMGLADVFLVKYNADGVKLWTRQLGTPSSDVARAIATDATGHIYLTGSTYGQMNRDTSNTGLSDLFVTKYNAQGTAVWTRQLGTPNFDHAYGIATDHHGNIYIGGSTYGNLDGNRRVGQSDLFVVKYNSQGAKLWTRQLGTPGSDVAHAVSTDAAGNVYVAGYTNDGLDGNPATGRSDVFVVKYDPHATKLWTRQLGTPSWDVARSVATDAMGNVYATGFTNNHLDGTSRTGLPDLFVIKYDPQGANLRAHRLGPPG